MTFSPIVQVTAALVAALLLWPAASSGRRLRVVLGSGRSRTTPRDVLARVPGGAALLGAAAVTGLVVFGVAGALAALAVTATARGQWRAHTAFRDQVRAVQGLAESLGSFAEGLRAGAHPADAATAAAAEAPAAAGAVLTAMATAARLGGDLDSALGATGDHALGTHLRQLGVAVRLATRHGLPLADVLDAVRRDLRDRARHAASVHARMAGPRATAAVLAVLPVVGVGLGQAMGAAPVRVLAGTALGQVMLVLGAGLGCTGVLWSARLTGRAVLS